MANDGEDHALVADEEATIEFALIANTSTESKKLETLKQEKEGVDGKLAGLLTASKDLDNLIESQRSDKNKEGLGYNAVPTPPVQLYLSPKKDLSWTGLLECADDTVTDYSRPSPTIESTSEEDQNRNPSVFENVASPIIPKPFIKFVKPKDSQCESPEFVLKKKACFNCGDFNHLAYEYRKKVRKSFTPKPVAHRLYKPSQRPMRTNMNGASPNRTSFNKQAHSYGNRPFHRTSTVRSPYRPPCVPTVNRYFPPANRKFSTGSRNFPTANRKFSTASRKFPTGSTKSPTADMGMKGKAVKPSACWSWKPSENLSNKGPKNNSVSVMFKKYTCIDTQGRLKSDSGCSRHMTGNISYLSDYEPFDRGYVSFGQGGCKITGNGTIKTGELEFENVYFVKDLKYNLFSVLQIYDNKNSVLFTDSECIVLGRDFKLLDDANILLRTPRQHNMYSIDLNNIVPQRDLTCFVAKASADECTLSTNLSSTKDTASQEVKKDVSSLRYIALPNWAHDALLEFIQTLTVKTPILTISSQVPTAYSTDSQDSSSDARLISKRVVNQEETPSLDNILPLTNWFEDILGDPSWVEAMQEELLQFKIQMVWTLVDCPKGEEWIDYDEVFSLVARIEAIRLFLAYASFMGFTVYQMDVKSAFLYGTIDEEVYVMQPPRFQDPQDPEYPAKVDKVEKAMYGLHQAPRAWHQITPKECYLHAVKRIFRYLKGHPKLGLWYPKDSPFDLVTYSDSDYGGATQDRKSTTGGCQFLGRRLISWQCKKQTIVATSTTEAEYVAAASCRGQVL
nr:hypothetical protein [Tanacetum cinerariifolium]